MKSSAIFQCHHTDQPSCYTGSLGYPRFPGALGWCQSTVSIVRRTPRRPYPSRAHGSYKCSSSYHTRFPVNQGVSLFPSSHTCHRLTLKLWCVSLPPIYFPVYTRASLMSASVICFPPASHSPPSPLCPFQGNFSVSYIVAAIVFIRIL